MIKKGRFKNHAKMQSDGFGVEMTPYPLNGCTQNTNERMCFVCMSDIVAPRSNCNCTDRYLHQECMIQLITKTGCVSCPVCKIPYNVEIKHTVKRQPTLLLPFYVSLIIANSILIISLVALVATQAYLFTIGKICTIVVLCTWFCVLVASIVGLYIARNDGAPCIETVPETRVVALTESLAI